MTKGVRTALIIVAIAAVVWAIPSGERSSDAVGQALSALIWATFVLIGVRVYREGRGRIELLGDAHRLLLYGSIGLIVVAMAARPGMVGTGGGTLVWIVLLGAAVAMLYAVWQRWREVA
ncbi:MAG: hypothetical protein ITG02_12095 [Patulibacter sp.]|nr:hypothetical protein [Patulibacter sp.]